jgi:putative transcriptional regulator
MLACLTALGYAREMGVEVELAAPAFLIAVPQLGDPNFNRGVVFILEHNDEGSMGLVINRPSNLDLRSFTSTQNLKFRGDGSGLVYHGGPVQTDRAFILHASEHQGPETEQVMGDTRLSYSLESLRLIAEQPPPRMRIFLGYAGWGPGQLAREITAGAWLLAPAAETLVFDSPVDQIWELALRQMGIDPVLLMHSGAVH